MQSGSRSGEVDVWRGRNATVRLRPGKSQIEGYGKSVLDDTSHGQRSSGRAIVGVGGVTGMPIWRCIFFERTAGTSSDSK